MSKFELVLVVDGTNLVMRAIKAMQHSSKPMSSRGVPTGALHAFVGSLSRYVRLVEPDRVVVCWDGGKSEYRHGVFPDYKSGRRSVSTEQLEDKESAFSLIKKFLSLAGFHHVEVAGYEADDLIAYYWKRLSRMAMVILSGDKDLLQLITSDTIQLRPGHPIEQWDMDQVQKSMGCEPRHWGAVLALAGDASDGIPGVPRVGIKTACKDLSKVDWHISEINYAHDRYIEYADLIERNLKLIDLRNSMAIIGLSLPEPPSFTPTVHESVLWKDLLRFLDHYELNSIRDRALKGFLWSDSGRFASV